MILISMNFGVVEYWSIGVSVFVPSRGVTTAGQVGVLAEALISSF
jgi:hypothetical protein